MLWSPNLQLHYPFENQANDYSGNARHGTVFGSGVYATKPNGGRCLYFDGVGDYVRTSSFGLSGTVVVFACWVRCKTFTARQALLGDNAETNTVGFFECYRLGSSGDLIWQYADGSSNQKATATSFFGGAVEDIWLHVAVVCDYAGKKTYFYRNGIPFGSPVTMNGTPDFPSTARVKYLGCYNTSAYLLTAGYLANVQLWTLATNPPVGVRTANANRLMLGMNPIW